MVIVEIDDKSTFLYDAENLAVHIWDYSKGKYDGSIIGQVGLIKFSNIDQARQFMEMLEFILGKD